MAKDIVIIRDGERYQLLHGHLRLMNLLRTNEEISVDIMGEGKVKVMKTVNGYGYLVTRDERQFPLQGN